MKNFLYLLAATAMLFMSCQTRTEQAPVDKEAEAAAINVVVDKFYSVFETKDPAVFTSVLTEDVLGLGSDPSEFLSKQDITDMWTQMLEVPVPDFNFISDRTFKIAGDGHSAIVIDQFQSDMYTANIPWRIVYNLVKTDGNWMINFFSSSLIPRNEDIPKLNDALNTEE